MDIWSIMSCDILWKILGLVNFGLSSTEGEEERERKREEGWNDGSNKN